MLGRLLAGRDVLVVRCTSFWRGKQARLELMNEPTREGREGGGVCRYHRSTAERWSSGGGGEPVEASRQVLVDADACPRAALAVLRSLQSEYGYRLVTVASFNHVLTGPDHVVVGNGPDEADLALANRTRPGDIVVTQDWGLAALALAKGARALSPKGLVYSPGNIDFLLDERSTKAKVRRRGGRTKGPAARTAEDDEHFTAVMRLILDGREVLPVENRRFR